MKVLRNAARAIIVRDEHVLTIQYADEGGEYYALPGGAQLHGETLTDALVRECQEELGATVLNRGLRFVREYIGSEDQSAWRDADFHQVEFLFECTLHPGQELGQGTHYDYTQVGTAWLPVAQISQYRFYPKTLVKYLGSPLPDRIEYWGSVE